MLRAATAWENPDGQRRNLGHTESLNEKKDPCAKTEPGTPANRKSRSLTPIRENREWVRDDGRGGGRAEARPYKGKRRRAVALQSTHLPLEEKPLFATTLSQ